MPGISNGKQKNVKPQPQLSVTTKPLVRIRIRCEKNPKVWIKNLFIMWAEKGPSNEDANSSKSKPKFTLCKSDGQGYLCNIDDKGKLSRVAIPLVNDTPYLFYFIRHPDYELAKDLHNNINGNNDNQNYDSFIKNWGKPMEIKINLEKTGKDKDGKEIFEGVIKATCSSESYIPKGSEFYGKWILFRGMPEENCYMKCDDLKNQVKRLQYHLGALRYIVGNHWHPYSPVPLNEKKENFPNEGIFDIITWNSVIAFQKDAQDGEAFVIDPEKIKYPIVSRNNTNKEKKEMFNPIDVNALKQIEDSINYKTNSEAKKDEAKSEIFIGSGSNKVRLNKETGDAIGVVGKNTGDAILKWLENNYRKPGKILVAYWNDVQKHDWVAMASWMHEDAYERIKAIDEDLRKWGFTKGLQFVGTFRDIRMDVYNAGPGRIRLSIHKTGLAFDFLEKGFIEPYPDYEIYFEPLEPPKPKEDLKKQINWVIWGKVNPEIHNVNQEKPSYIEYKENIKRWIYDQMSDKGVEEKEELRGKFLNITKICKENALEPIPSHSKGWFAYGNEFTLSTDENFRKFFDCFSNYMAIMESKKSNPNFLKDSIKIKKGVEELKVDESQVKKLYKDLNLWLNEAKAIRFGGNVLIDFIDPSLPDHQKFLEKLRNKEFNDLKVKIEIIKEFTCKYPDLEDRPDSVDRNLGANSEDFPEVPFKIFLITDPELNKDTKILIPIPGHPAHLEWWHFQFNDLIKGKTWGGLLKEIGFTEEGLLGKKSKDDKGIYGYYGLGYTESDLNSRIS